MSGPSPALARRSLTSCTRRPASRPDQVCGRKPGRGTRSYLQGDTLLRRFVDHLEEWLIATLIAAATMLIFVSVVHRYGTGLSIDLSKWAALKGFMTLSAGAKSVFVWFSSWDLSWSQELCIIMFVWMAKFGAAYGVRTGVHVGVDVVLNN